MVGATIRSSGDKIDCDNLKLCFVQGAYNLGAVYEIKEIITTILHAGETVCYPTGAAGEDNILINPVEGISPIGLVEWDEAQVVGVSTDYAVADEVPTILYHWNPGALIRNVQCEDQAGDVADAGKLLTTSSTTAGYLMILTETALVDTNGTGTGEAYAPGLTWGDMGTLHHNRTPMRQAHFETDNNADYTVVAWILNT